MSNKIKTILFIMAAVAALGYVGHVDMKTAQLEEAANTCQTSDSYTTPTFAECINNQLENNNDK